MAIKKYQMIPEVTDKNAMIVDQDGVWIAKFPSIDDASRISIPRFEHAVMLLGEACGIRVAKTKLHGCSNANHRKLA